MKKLEIRWENLIESSYGELILNSGSGAGL